jgi:hypothetical protein
VETLARLGHAAEVTGILRSLVTVHEHRQVPGGLFAEGAPQPERHVGADERGGVVDSAHAGAPVERIGTASGLRITGLKSNLSSPSSMERTVTFTASASGGSGPYQYKWFVFDGTSWTMVRNWSTTATLAWRPTAPGAYRIGIWARDATTAADTSALNFSVPYIVTP